MHIQLLTWYQSQSYFNSQALCSMLGPGHAPPPPTPTQLDLAMPPPHMGPVWAGPCPLPLPAPLPTRPGWRWDAPCPPPCHYLEPCHDHPVLDWDHQLYPAHREPEHRPSSPPGKKVWLHYDKLLKGFPFLQTHHPPL